jgi:nitrogen regulatory protein PII
MKLLIIICDTALEGEITKFLEKENLNYSKFHNVLGKGRTGKKENNPIWPGLNMMFYILTKEEFITKITDEIKEIQKLYIKVPGCKIFSVEAEEIL